LEAALALLVVDEDTALVLDGPLPNDLSVTPGPRLLPVVAPDATVSA
jgi:hypothetical protein